MGEIRKHNYRRIMKQIKIPQGRIKYEIVNGDDQVGSYLILMSISVKEEYRNKGFGSKLVNLLIETAKKNNIKEIITFANTDGLSDIFGKFLIKNKFEKTYYNVFSKQI